jgi:NAD+ kinase
MIHADHRNPTATAFGEALGRALKSRDADLGELAIVIGGDGWMLHTIHNHGPGKVWLGLNSGNLGFLLNELGEPAATANALCEGRFTVHDFPRLQLEATTPDGGSIEATAVNEILAERKTGQTAHLRLDIDGETLVDELVCDGILVATALGSTAYSFSAGGVPCHPMAPILHITPVCPHAPRLSPIVLPLDKVIELEVLSPDKRPVGAVADGIDHGPIQRLRIRRADQDVRLAFLEGHKFTRTMIEKVLKS